MTTVGADRFFSQVITKGVAPEAMPTIAFVIAVIMALATGSSWSTMTILFPLLMVPTYNVSNGDELIFYSTVAGVLSGSVAGDHMSPISDTTVISAMSCGCKLLDHVTTQAPYSLLIVLYCILFGTIPIGRDAMPNIVGILLGFVAIVGTVFFVGAPITNTTGRFDILTELVLKVWPNHNLEELRKDTIHYNEHRSRALTDKDVDEKNPDDVEDVVEAEDIELEEVEADVGKTEDVKGLVKLSQLSHIST